MADLTPYILLLATILAGGSIGYLLMSNGWRRAYGAVLAGHVFALIGLWLAVQSRSQMDGMVHWVFLIMFVLPSLIGVALGGGVAWFLQRRAGR